MPPGCEQGGEGPSSALAPSAGGEGTQGKMCPGLECFVRARGASSCLGLRSAACPAASHLDVVSENTVVVPGGSLFPDSV